MKQRSEASFAYLIRMFPQTSETFVANEILHQERLGLSLKVYSCRRPVDRVTHAVVRLIQSPVHYLPDPLWKSTLPILRTMLAVRRRNPRGFGVALRFTARKSLRELSIERWKRLLQASCLAWELQEDGIRHIHAHFAHTATDITWLASMITGIPFSFTGHAKDVYTARHRDLQEKLDAAEFAVTCTGANVDYLSEIAGPQHMGKLKLAYHGVDLDKFNYRETEPPHDLPLILSVGRLVKKKGFGDLVAALGLLRDRGVRFRALIVGDGEERKAIEEQVSALGLDDLVSLPGSVTQEELVPIYAQATVFALPCRVLDDGDRDGLPNVLLESMSIGLPVVTTPISGIPEAVRHGENGLLVPERDVAALAAALELLLSDPELRHRLGANARQTIAAEMSVDAMAERLAGLFFGAIGRGEEWQARGAVPEEKAVEA